MKFSSRDEQGKLLTIEVFGQTIATVARNAKP